MLCMILLLVTCPSCSCYRNEMSRFTTQRVDTLLCLAYGSCPSFELRGECVQLCTFQDSRLNPGNIDSPGHFIERSAYQRKTVLISRVRMLLARNNSPERFHYQMLYLVYRQTRGLSDLLKCHQPARPITWSGKGSLYERHKADLLA